MRAIGEDESERMRSAEFDFIDRTLMGDERNRTLFDWSPEAIVIVNKQGVFIDANKKLFEWLGYRPEEVIGKNLLEIPFFTKNSKEIIYENFTQRMMGKNIPQYEISCIHKDGTEKWGEIHATLLQDNTNNITLDLIMVSDITERKKVVEKLQENEEKFRMLFENTYDLIQSVDEQGKFIDVNPRWLETLEYSRDEVKKLCLTDIVRKDQISHCQEILKRISQGKHSKNIEIVFLSKTGKEIRVKGNAHGLFKDGEFIGTIGIFQQI